MRYLLLLACHELSAGGVEVRARGEWEVICIEQCLGGDGFRCKIGCMRSMSCMEQSLSQECLVRLHGAMPRRGVVRVRVARVCSQVMVSVVMYE